MKRIFFLLTILSALCADAQIVNRFRDSTNFYGSVRMDSIVRITKGAAANKVLTSSANGTATWQNAANIYNANGTVISDRTVTLDTMQLEFTTNSGHNLIFTDDFLGQGWDFAGIYHNDAGVVYLNGIAERSTLIFSGIGVIDNVNLTNSYAQADTQLATIGYIPNMADITRTNTIESRAQGNVINSSDNDSTKTNVQFSHSNGDGTTTQVASVYRDGAIATDSGFYIGDKTTDGSWRFVTSGADLVIQKRESGSWVTKQTITP